MDSPTKPRRGRPPKGGLAMTGTERAEQSHRRTTSVCAERGWIAQTRVYYSEAHREIIRHEAKARGEAIEVLLSEILDDALQRFAKQKRTPMPPRGPLDLGIDGIKMSWSHRIRVEGNKRFVTHGLLIVTSVVEEPGGKLISKTFHAGSPAKITQARLDDTIAKACAVREHHNRIVRGEVPFKWLPLTTLTNLYSKVPRPHISLDAVMAELEKDYPQVKEAT